MYFKILPIVWFILFTSTAIAFARKIKNSSLFVGLFLFFLFFGSSFSFLLTLYHNSTIWESASTLSMQAGQTLINLQFAFSLVIYLLLLFLIHDNKVTFKKTFLLSLLLSFGIGLKFYGGIIMCFTVGMYYLRFFLKSRNILLSIAHISILLIFFIPTLIFLYDPLSPSRTGSIFKFAPLATVHPFIEERQLFYIKDTVNARYFLESLHKISFKLIRIELITFFLYVFFNFGTRFFGFIYILKSSIAKKLSWFEVNIFFSIIFAILLNALLIQKGEWWNTVQFLYYGAFLSNIFIAKFIHELFSKKNIFLTIFSILLLLLTLPSNIDLIRVFSTFPPGSYLDQKEIAALSFLKQLPDGVVFSPIYSQEEKQKIQNDKNPRGLYILEDNAYISAFSHKQTFIADLVQLRLTGVDYKNRLKDISSQKCSFMSQIRYVYLLKPFDNSFFESCLKGPKIKAERIFNNQLVEIYSLKSGN